MNEENNRKIFTWLNPEKCYHDWKREGLIWVCSACGVSGSNRVGNPNYTSDRGFFLLLAGLREKDLHWEGGSHGMVNDGTNVWRPTGYWAKVWREDDGGNQVEPQDKSADSLPEALANAVLKLIEQEGK